MPRERVTDAADDGILIGTLRQSWQMLANLQAVDVRVDGIEFTAKFRRSVRLHVERVHVWRPTTQIDEDRGLAFGGGNFAGTRHA